MRHSVIAIVGAVVLASSISLSRADEISASRAQRLASTYMMLHISGCGGTKQAIAHRTFWEFPVAYGRAGTPRGAIRVGRSTGTVSYGYMGQRYPTLTPKQLADEEYAYTHRG
jgi:hypothetical protein